MISSQSLCVTCMRRIFGSGGVGSGPGLGSGSGLGFGLGSGLGSGFGEGSGSGLGTGSGVGSGSGSIPGSGFFGTSICISMETPVCSKPSGRYSFKEIFSGARSGISIVSVLRYRVGYRGNRPARRSAWQKVAAACRHTR